MERDMKTRKLLDKLVTYLDGNARKRKRERDDLKAVLKKLKRRERKLLRAVEDEKNDDRRKALKKEADIVHAQRKKGVKLLKED
jgi:hypothetical protein